MMNKREIKFSDCTNLTKGKPPAVFPYYGDGAAPYLNPEFLRGNANTETAKPAINSVWVEDGDIVLLWDGSNAGEFFRGKKGLLASTMTKIIHNNEFELDYFYYALKQWESFLKGQTSGSGIPHVDKEILGKICILQLEKAEQTQIAAILSTIDKAIEQTEALIAKQQRIKAGLMQDLLTRGIDENGTIRSEATHAFKDSPLGRIPVEWDVAPMDKYGSKSRHYLRTGPFGSALNTKHWVEQGIPVFTIGSLGEGEILENQLLYISEQTAEFLKSYRVLSGDIVFSRVADIGRALVVTQKEAGWIISSNFMRISLDQSKARPLFFYHNISSNEVIHYQLRGALNAGGRDLVNGSILSRLIFPWPSLDEQDRINEAIYKIDKMRLESNKQLTSFKLLKIALMHDLLTGKVRVTELLNQGETQP